MSSVLNGFHDFLHGMNSLRKNAEWISDGISGVFSKAILEETNAENF